MPGKDEGALTLPTARLFYRGGLNQHFELCQAGGGVFLYVCFMLPVGIRY